MNFKTIEIGRYKIYYNEETDKYDIYDVYGRFMVSCTHFDTANQLVGLLRKDASVNKNDADIIDEANRINEIKEPHREPANRSSILNSDIAKMTRDLMSKYK